MIHVPDPEFVLQEGGFGVGQDGLGLDPASELLVQPLDGVGRPRRLPLRRVAPGEAEQPVAGADWHENQHGRWSAVAPALPTRFPGGVWRPAMKDRRGRERYEGYCTPVTYDPTPQQMAAPRRNYLAW
jgi:hypothetical protein